MITILLLRCLLLLWRCIGFTTRSSAGWLTTDGSVDSAANTVNSTFVLLLVLWILHLVLSWLGYWYWKLWLLCKFHGSTGSCTPSHYWWSNNHPSGSTGGGGGSTEERATSTCSITCTMGCPRAPGWPVTASNWAASIGTWPSILTTTRSLTHRSLTRSRRHCRLVLELVNWW